MSGTQRLLIVLLGLSLPATALAADGTAAIGGVAAAVVVCIAALVVARPWGMLLSTIVGAGISFYLAMEQHQSGSGICDVSELISCKKVADSPYAMLFGVPVALYGFGFYLAVGWLTSRYASLKKADTLALIQIAAILAVGFDVYLAWAMVQVGALCIFCTGTYALNISLLVASTVERRGKEGTVMAGLQSDGGPGAVIGLAGLLLGLWGSGGGQSTTKPTLNPAGPVTPSDLLGAYEQAAGSIHFEANDPLEGPPDAKFTLVEWADFQCPHCAKMFPELKKVMAENSDVQLRYKHYPISNACNHFVEWEGHKDSCRAAAAAACANAQNAFWPLAEKMFGNQEYLGKDDLRFMVQQVGLDMTAFEACMTDPATESAVREDVEAGGLAQLSGTPSIFLKGAFGDRWVRILGGYPEITAILKVARAGGQLPEPPPPTER